MAAKIHEKTTWNGRFINLRRYDQVHMEEIKLEEEKKHH